MNGRSSGSTLGYSTVSLFDVLDDTEAESVLPSGAFKLISALAPERVRGESRSETLASLFSIDLAIASQAKRSVLLNALPSSKVEELEQRFDLKIDDLREAEHLDAHVRRSVEGFFGKATLPVRVVADTRSNLTVAGGRSLFPHQKRVALEVERYLYREDGRVMMHLPTGVGKTRTAMSIVASRLRQKEGIVLWLAATKELLEQAVDEFQSTWQAVGDRTVECVRFWGGHNADLSCTEDGIVVAGLSKLHSYGRSREELWSLGDRTTMVIFDEAHQAVAPTYKDLVYTIVTRNPKTPLLGLSATPGRTWARPEIDEALAALFYRNKVTVTYSDKNPIRHLTESGYLSAVNFKLLNVEPGLRLSAPELSRLATSLDMPVDVADRLGEDEVRNLRIVEAVLDLVKRHHRVLVFAPSASNATLLAGICRGIGVGASAVTANTDDEERARIVRRFKHPDRDTQVLWNYGVLTTGFDAPGASAALIARPTKSLVLYSQMVGRVVRGPRAGGTKQCEVVTVVDTNLPGFGDVAEAFINWEDVWN